MKRLGLAAHFRRVSFLFFFCRKNVEGYFSTASREQNVARIVQNVYNIPESSKIRQQNLFVEFSVLVAKKKQSHRCEILQSPTTSSTVNVAVSRTVRKDSEYKTKQSNASLADDAWH